VAILGLQSEAEVLAEIVAQSPSTVTSAIAIFEAALAIACQNRSTVEEAEQDVGDVITVTGIEVLSVTDSDATQALAAFSRYGKGRGHPAQLNMGDCFAYALAKRRKAALLFKGQDFGRTDTEAARPPRPGP
jgi:ribonuclease VapC